MNFYVYTHSASTEIVNGVDQDTTALQCATVVLQHPNGSLGFNRGLGADAIKALVHDVVVIERANSPRWMQLKTETISSPAFHSQFTQVVTCSSPLPSLLQELQTVASNHLQAKKNNLRARYNRPHIPLIQTIFNNWISSDGLLVEHVAQELIGSCRALVLWPFSDWGIYANILARSSEEALGPVLQAGTELRIAVRRVKSESELPSW
jgi:hypothetical protein